MSNTVRLISPLQHQDIINGDDNLISVGLDCRVGPLIEITGVNNTIEIGDRVYVGHGWFGIKTNNARIIIGEGTTISGATLSAHESGSITIGRDCIISLEVFMDVSDMHPIFDLESKNRINPSADIVVGDHVWIGLRAILTKGVTIGAGAIIGANSVVTGTVPAHSLVAGNPARIIRENVAWERSLHSPGPGMPGYP